MKFSPKKSVHALSLTALVLMAVLAGCSSEADGNPELEETTDASSPEPTEYVPASAEGPAQNVPEPRLPAVTTEDSEEGAIAALQYFWEAELYASLTGNSEPLIVVSSDECAFCTESIEGWPRNYERGYWSAMHGEIEVEVTEVVRDLEDKDSANVAHLYFELVEPPTDFYDEEGNRSEGSFDSSEKQDWLAELTYDATAQSWQVEWLGLEDAVVWED